MIGRGLRQPGWRAWLALIGLGLVAAGYVAMTEVGAIVAEATPTGGTSLSALFGIGQVTSIADLTTTTQTLTAWAHATGPLGQQAAPRDLSLWLCCYLGFDLLFVAGYTVAGLTLLPGRAAAPVRWLLAALVAVHVIQDVVAAWIFVAIQRPWGPFDPLVIALHVATVAKWLLVLALLVGVAYLAWDTETRAVRRAISEVAEALLIQRYSVVLVTLLIIIAAGSGSDILQQMPDVPRAWLSGNGWEPAVVAVIAEALLALLLVFLGRMRTRRAEDKYYGRECRSKPGYLLWLAVPAALVVLAVLLRLAGVVEVGWARLAVAVGLPLAIGVISLAIVWRLGADNALLTIEAQPAAADAEDKVNTVRVTGDALAVAAVAVPGLGLVRSFTGPALLVGGWYAAAAWAAVAVGFVFATLTWPLADGPGRSLLRGLAQNHRSLIARVVDEGRRGPQSGASVWADAWPWLVVGAPFLAAVGWLLFWPLSAVHWLGVLGTTVIALGTLTMILAVLAYFAQTRQPVPLFRIMRLNVTPVLSVILAIGLVGGVVDSKSLLHVARGPVGATSTAAWGAPGTTFMDALGAWLADKTVAATCSVPAADGSVRVQPLILVAAAGGGIRAAWWAEHAMADFAATACGRHDVFAVSSVSGGSVGMAILDSAQAPGGNPDQAADADILRIAGPDALSAGLDGLLLHDMIAGFTGLDLPAAQMPPGQQFADRADLIESVWSNEDPGLKQSFPLQNPALPWRLLFNSTTVGTGCRAIIADRALPGTTPGPAQESPVTCDLQTSTVGGGSYDFFARLGCQRGIAVVTAAMLSARFPYVTPSGVVTGCGAQQGVPVGQFVDGGYVDSSGLMTVADLIPAITGELRAFNANALAQAGRSGQPATLVVPLVMYLGNSPRPAAGPAPVPPLAEEPDIPLSTQSAASADLTVSDTLLQRIGGLIGNGQWLACPPASAPSAPSAACASAVSQADQVVGDQLFLVAPSVAPQISAPLGWVLSPASQQALDAALSRESGYRCGVDENAPAGVCEPGVGHLGDILALVNR